MQATSKLAQEFFKLMTNSAYGKTVESKRNRRKVKLVRSYEEALQCTDKFYMKSFTIFNEKLAAVTFAETCFTWDKPILVGAVILDLAKAFMYDFHYNTMKHAFQDVKLLYSDTDSFVYAVTTKDLPNDLGALQEKFDFSN